MERAVRKAKSDLMLNGFGTIMFGVWILLKNILYHVFAKIYLTSVFGAENPIQMDMDTAVFLWILLSIFAMLLHLVIGIQSIREGSGRGKRRNFYLVLAVVMVLVNITEIVFNLSTAYFMPSLLDYLCDLLMETARLINFIALLMAARRVRKLSDEAVKEAAVHAA